MTKQSGAAGWMRRGRTGAAMDVSMAVGTMDAPITDGITGEIMPAITDAIMIATPARITDVMAAVITMLRTGAVPAMWVPTDVTKVGARTRAWAVPILVSTRRATGVRVQIRARLGV